MAVINRCQVSLPYTDTTHYSGPVSVGLSAGAPVDIGLPEIYIFVEKEDQHDRYEGCLPLNEEHYQETQKGRDKRNPFVIETKARAPAWRIAEISCEGRVVYQEIGSEEEI